MNIKKLAVVSILCIVIVVSAFLVYYFAEKTTPTIEMSAEYLGFGEVRLNIQNNVDSDAKITYRIVAYPSNNNGLEWEDDENRVIFAKAHSNENVTVMINVHIAFWMNLSVKILKVEKIFA